MNTDLPHVHNLFPKYLSEQVLIAGPNPALKCPLWFMATVAASPSPPAVSLSPPRTLKLSGQSDHTKPSICGTSAEWRQVGRSTLTNYNTQEKFVSAVVIVEGGHRGCLAGNMPYLHC
ncbi:hypothetical protein K439DRAFT_223727 [Ramaria rubella]|nr:hypothetical protein K439DRAFT_223727 [Ramaria rubella]